MADLESVRRLADAAGPVDVLVNNAGIFPFSPTVDQDQRSSTRCLRSTCGHPSFAHRRDEGAIVNVSTAGAEIGVAGTAAYAASKAALASLTRTWAAEFGPTVRVNAVAPGPTLSETVFERVGQEAAEQIAGSAHLGRAATPEEIANAIVFLASPGRVIVATVSTRRSVASNGRR